MYGTCRDRGRGRALSKGRLRRRPIVRRGRNGRGHIRGRKLLHGSKTRKWVGQELERSGIPERVSLRLIAIKQSLRVSCRKRGHVMARVRLASRPRPLTMPPKSHLAVDLIDHEFLEVERRQQGKRKTIAESANPIIERGPKKGKAPTVTSKATKASSDVKPNLGEMEQGQPKRMDQDPSDGHSAGDTAQDWQTSWWDDDAGDLTAQEAKEPKPSYKPGLFERDPNAKTSDGKVRPHAFVSSASWLTNPDDPRLYGCLARDLLTNLFLHNAGKGGAGRRVRILPLRSSRVSVPRLHGLSQSLHDML